MDNLKITYRFNFPDGNKAEFPVEISRDTIEVVRDSHSEVPEWTRLEFHKCPHCPLDETSHPQCPLSASISSVVARFESILSYEQMDVEVETEERTVTKSVSAQQGLSALLGLIMATSGCPHTGFLKPMARFHLPLASEEETVYRAVSMYLLAQYFTNEEEGEPDLTLSGLRKIYENLQELNRAMATRIREAITQDAAVNAIVVLDFSHKRCRLPSKTISTVCARCFRLTRFGSRQSKRGHNDRNKGRSPMPIEQMTPPEAKETLDQDGDVLYLDVRTEQEFAMGHPERAINIPVVFPGPGGQMVPNPDFLNVVEKVIPKDATVVCGCQVGARSQMAAELMEREGYSKLFNMRGGFGGLQDPATGEVVMGWQDEGFPVESDVSDENSYAGMKRKAGSS